MYCTGAGTSPPQPLYPYEDIPTTIQGIAPLIQISPQVNTDYCIMAKGIFYGINFCDFISILNSQEEIFTYFSVGSIFHYCRHMCL